VLAGSVGWVARDRAARRAKTAAELQTALRDAREFQRAGKWPEALAAAAAARELLPEVDEGWPLAGEARRVLRELAEEEADRSLLERLERIRLVQSEVDVKANAFALKRGYREYRPAFEAYGWVPETVAAEDAAAALRRRPAAVTGSVAAALDHWLILARYNGAPEVGWLEEVLDRGDPDAWRRRVRQARKLNDLPALKALARDPAAIAQPPEELFLLGSSLTQRGAKGENLALLRRAREAFPGDFWLNHNLGTVLEECQPPQLDEAIRFLSVAVALRPDNAGSRLNLGIALRNRGRVDESIAAFRRAIELRPDYAAPHCQLAFVLATGGWPDEARAEARRVLELQPEYGQAYLALGDAWFCGSRFDKAEAAFRRATELEPDCAKAHCCLGDALLQQGRFAAALAAYERGHELGSRTPGWNWPSARWVRHCRRLCELEPQLPGLLRGDVRPAGDDLVAFAELCHCKGYFAAAARLRADSLAADPKPTGDHVLNRRYNAACAAARAAAGQGEDAATTGDEERTLWRKLALEWLRADLNDHARRLDGASPLDRQIARRSFRHWQRDPELETLRRPDALAALPADERRACVQLWADVASLLARPE
jgi:tetratricopeptide (TPR) repeat protein